MTEPWAIIVVAVIAAIPSLLTLHHCVRTHRRFEARMDYLMDKWESFKRE